MAKKITTKKEEQRKEAQRRGTERLVNDEVFSDISIDFAKSKFILYQMEKGNSKQTIAFYERFFKKFYQFLEGMKLDGNASISWLTAEPTQLAFVSSLGNVNQQTVNAYLRGYRAFGNYCEEAGMIDGFHCPIKEVEPPAKEVYTDKELQKLLVKPDIRYFNGFRDYTIINLILATGARTNTILNIKIKDVELDEGYITYNTTKAHKVVRLGLERKCKSILQEYISYWRKVGDGDITAEDYLFCNIYGEQLTRGGLSTAIARYNREHGVYKTSIHLFRHTFAKKWITSGGDIITLSRVLTHSELDMVKRYSNLYGYDVKEEIEEHSVLAQLRTHSGETLTKGMGGCNSPHHFVFVCLCSTRANNSLGRKSRACAILLTVSMFAFIVPFSIIVRCVRAIPARPLKTSCDRPLSLRMALIVSPSVK